MKTKTPALSDRKGSQDSFLIPKDTPASDKSSWLNVKGENRYTGVLTENRKLFIKKMSRNFGGMLTDKQIASVFGVTVGTVGKYKKLIKKEMETKQ